MTHAYILHFIVTHRLVSQSVTVSNSRWLVMDSTDGDSASSMFMSLLSSEDLATELTHQPTTSLHFTQQNCTQ
jgi:hypothetical protein